MVNLSKRRVEYLQQQEFTYTWTEWVFLQKINILICLYMNYKDSCLWNHPRIYGTEGGIYSPVVFVSHRFLTRKFIVSLDKKAVDFEELKPLFTYMQSKVYYTEGGFYYFSNKKLRISKTKKGLLLELLYYLIKGLREGLSIA